MLSKRIDNKMDICRVISNNHAAAILLELYNARALGIESVSHEELSTLVNTLQHSMNGALYWSTSIKELKDTLGIIEMRFEEGKPYSVESISYRLNPNMDEFSAKLIEMMFDGEKGMRDSLPQQPKEVGDIGENAII